MFVRHWVILIGLQLLAADRRVIDFDGLPPGAAPPGWTVAMAHEGPPARWEVRRDESAPTKPYVLAQVSRESAVNRHPLAILDGVAFRDGDVSVRFKPAAVGDQAGGLVWRYRDPLNYYVVRANAAEKTVAVYRVQNGEPSALLPPARYDEIAANNWSTLKITARGPKFQVYVDHRRILEGQDGAFAGPGKVGVCTVDKSEVYFDDFRVYPR